VRGEITAAEVGKLAARSAGLPGVGSGLGVLEQAMRAALTAAIRRHAGHVTRCHETAA
jgi:hypothetical protein